MTMLLPLFRVSAEGRNPTVNKKQDKKIALGTDRVTSTEREALKVEEKGQRVCL